MVRSYDLNKTVRETVFNSPNFQSKTEIIQAMIAKDTRKKTSTNRSCL